MKPLELVVLVALVMGLALTVAAWIGAVAVGVAAAARAFGF